MGRKLAILVLFALVAGCGDHRGPYAPGQPSFSVTVNTTDSTQTSGESDLLSLTLTSKSTQPFTLQYLQNVSYQYHPASAHNNATVLGTFSAHINGSVVGAHPQTPVPLGPGQSVLLYLGDTQVQPGQSVNIDVYVTITGALPGDKVVLSEGQVVTDKGTDDFTRFGQSITIR